MSRHVADKRIPSTGSRVRQFLKIARPKRETWHSKRAAAGPSRMAQFLRIARGRMA